jgi:[acyl-carrier-protein] S-malonyltransferase
MKFINILRGIFTMEKNALLFTGQGSQTVGMSKELFEIFPKTADIYKCGSDILGFDLQKLMFEGNESELAKNSQPAIMTGSLVALYAAGEIGVKYGGVAGHSLGEYAAMYAAGVIDLETAFKLIKIRQRVMNEAADGQDGGMAAVIGANAETVADVCKTVRESGLYIAPVNYNSPVQTVIAGTSAALAAAEPLLKEKKAKRFMKLNVTAAFHSELMKDAAEKFKEEISGFSFKPSTVKFYSNLYGSELTDFTDMQSYLSKHICSPVMFTNELSAMKNDGFEKYVECGGKVLTGLVKKTLADVQAYSLSDGKDFADLTAAVTQK